MYSIKYPIAFHPVDIAILRTTEGRIQVLLAQKIKDAEGGQNIWRFPGGFIDPWDSCAEEAAFREAMEETGMTFIKDPSIGLYFNNKKVKVKEITDLIEHGQNGLYDPIALSSKIKQLESSEFDLGQKFHSLRAVKSLVKYIGSTKIDDYRYKDTDHKVITSFYKIQHVDGDAGEGPFDDIARTKWFYLSELKEDDMHPAHKILHQMLLEDQKAELAVEGVMKDLYDMYASIDNNIENIVKQAKHDTEEAIRKAYSASKSVLNKLFKKEGE